MATRQNGRTIKDGLVFGFDTGDTYNSYLGRPTDNLGYNASLNNYNNVPGSVTTNLTQTSDTYRGAPIWTQTLTPLDGSGVSWLSNGNNPGLGVVVYGTGSGGGTANRYTGFSIFFKSTVPMNSTPIFLGYSNIGGWQCNTCAPEDMGDGWFRARVLWYNTVTQSDGKFWAINPLSASLNVPITIYWAGPFKEDLNSTAISQYVYGTRSATQGLRDLTGNHSLDLSNITFNTDIRPKIQFDGSDDFITLPSSAIPTGNEISIEIVTSWNGSLQNNSIIAGGSGGSQDLSLHLPWGDGNVYWDFGRPFNRIYKAIGSSDNYLGNHHWVVSKNSITGIMRIFLDGTLWHYGGGQTSTTPLLDSVSIGRYDNGSTRAYYYKGDIPVLKIYNKELTPEEVHKNYLHYKSRYGLRDVKSLTSLNTLGAASESASPSAKLLQEVGITTNGNYWLKPFGIVTPFLAYVEFDSNGGDPWVHVGTIDDENAPSNDPNYHKWSNDMNPSQSCPPWDDESTFGGSTPTFVSDYKNTGWSSIPFKQIMIKDAGNSQRKLLYTNEGQIKSSNSSLREWFGSLKWGAVGSDTSNSAVSAQRVKSLNITNYGVNDPVLQSSGKTKLLFKYGEIDGAQDGNKDRTMIAWHRHDAADGVDGPSGLGCFTNRSGTIDYRDIVPGSVYGSGQDFPPSSIGGSYYYSIWIR
jgi:hypothetical protein